jgi:hypothetical protein
LSSSSSSSSSPSSSSSSSSLSSSPSLSSPSSSSSSSSCGCRRRRRRCRVVVVVVFVVVVVCRPPLPLPACASLHREPRRMAAPCPLAWSFSYGGGFPSSVAVARPSAGLAWRFARCLPRQSAALRRRVRRTRISCTRVVNFVRFCARRQKTIFTRSVTTIARRRADIRGGLFALRPGPFLGMENDAERRWIVSRLGRTSAAIHLLCIWPYLLHAELQR